MRRFAATLALFSALGGPAAASGTAAVPAHAPSATAVHAVKPFARPGLADAAKQLAESLDRDDAGRIKGHVAADFFAAGLKAKPDSSDALESFGAAIAAGRDDSLVWLDFATAAEGVSAALPETDSRRGTIGDWVAPAAYRSYQLATTPQDEAAALKLAGASLARREAWRDALDSDRASLAVVEDPALRAAYNTLREAHGFHYEDYKIDADAAAPRVCLTFSEELAGSGPDLARFVAVDGSATAAVSVDGHQLCVEGLTHGQRYQITIRRGLPSVVAETLQASVNDAIFVPDRAPRVSFAGNAYVLPRVGAEGIPLISINVEKADVTVLRIGDRSLLSIIHSNEFRDQVSRYRFDDMAQSDASPVWSGTLDTAGTLNQESRTAFPVRDAVGPLKPGVYVMRAKPHAEGVKDDDADANGATQWFVVSDLGLTTLSGEGGITTLVRSLATAKPVAGAAVNLVAKNNEVLDTRTTGPDGAVRFDPGLSRGHGGNAPALLVASTADGDYDFLDLAVSPFDLTERGDKGRPASEGLDALVYAERGVYRSGETVYLTALLRDGQGTALSGLPLTLVISRPDGVENQRVVLPDAGLGGHTLALPVLSDAASGTWRVAAYVDPKGPSVGETTFLVEDYLPERLSFDLKSAASQLKPGDQAAIGATVRFLYGAPGSGLEITGDSVVDAAPGPSWPTLDGYTTGLTDERVEAVTTALAEPVLTGQDGRATVAVPVPAIAATRPLQAKIRLTAGEPGGRSIERSVTIPILPATALIGVKSTVSPAGDGGTAAFGVVTVDAQGRRSAVKDLQWRISRLGRDYQWYQEDGRWRFERIASTRLIANGIIDTNASTPASITAPLRDGRYRLELSSDDPALPPTSLDVNVGFSGDDAANPAPDLLDVTLDRSDYLAGDTLHATVTSRFAGHATLVIGDGPAQVKRDLDVTAGDTVLDVPVDGHWGTGAYVMVLAHRPLDVTAKRMPGRSLGLAWFSIDAASRDIGVRLDVPKLARPRSTLRVPVKLTGLPPGEAAEVAVSAVDVGILNLTRYETPQPVPFFFGQRTLGLDVRDLYGALIDGLGVPGGAIRSGGDGGAELSSDKPTQAPLARYSGIVPVKPDGTATVEFDIPAFNGTVRVAAIAWSKGRTGSAEADVVLRDPVVVAATLPRFLDLGDRARARFEIDDVEGPAGAYRLQVEPRGPWFLPAAALDQTVQLVPGTRTGVDVPVTAAGLGTAALTARLTGPGGFDVSQDVALGIEPGAPAVYRRDIHPLAPGQTLTLSRELLAEFVPGSGSVSVAVSPLGDIDVPALLLALDRYPVGCSEQIVSRALPLLYVDRLAPPRELAMQEDLPDRIRGAVAQLVSRQTAEGSFGLWSADSGTEDAWLDSYVTDFLTRARESGYAVPARAMDSALDRLRNVVANGAAEKGGDALPLGYAAYVLARNSRPIMGDLRYLAGSRLDAIATPLGKAQVGAALALLGDRARAAPVFAAATAALASEQDGRDYREDYGSKLRDAAAVLALAAEAGLDDVAARAGGLLAAAQRAPYPTNTQEQAWLVLAAQAVEKQAVGMALDIDGARHAGPLYRALPASRLDDGALVIGNGGRAPVDVVVTTSGQLPTPEAAAAQGYTLERHYYHIDGQEADPTQVKQNERLAVVLKVTEVTATRARLLLTDPLPAGFEIDNPALVQDGAVPDLPGFDVKAEPSHTEFRDDRFTAAYDRVTDGPASFSVAYMVRAVTPGRFVHPPAVIEDMYRPERFGRTSNGRVEIRAAP